MHEVQQQNHITLCANQTTSMQWCVLLLPLLYSVLGQPQVEIDSGLLSGAAVDTHYPDGNGGNITINAFHGIPYATPPVGDLRFRVGSYTMSSLISFHLCGICVGDGRSQELIQMV